ncbi:glycosyltransferase family 4 protein [Allobranchiibius sp. GilTou38]|uniref:glycosyltransferase n=1 Tax=Allobranchiibius sp. GilTou38 TaxID=2815210 RepID=UPI001AA1ADB5|nr:glycosyltransferase family 4 protein [Allobranchiibius sp. GilTou38]
MRVALSSYRSKPHSGGQGVYVRNLSRELVALGHDVHVFSGPPYPDLDHGVTLTCVPSLDLYRHPDRFHHPRPSEFHSDLDVLEYLTMCTSGFPEPRMFGARLSRLLRDRVGEFDILHDNQTLAPGILDLERRGLPLLTTIHHPISRDRRLELAAARGLQRVTKRRWYGFVKMQARVARRSAHLLTVSHNSAADIEQDFKVPAERLAVVPVGVDVATFVPPSQPRVTGRIVTIASADVPLKGLDVLIRALAGVDPAAWSELVVVGRASERTSTSLAKAGLLDRVHFRHDLSDADLAELLASAEVHAIPSLYEGFSLPAVEAMACGTPIVASSVGALPELVGTDAGVLVEAGDAPALGRALADVFAAPDRRSRMGAAGRARAVSTYSWRAVAEATADVYEQVRAARRATSPRAKENAA